MPKHILYLLILVDFMMTLDCQHPPPKKSKEEVMLLDKLREHYNAQTSINGPAQVKVISQEYNKNMHLKCMVNVTYSGHFSWKLNNKTLSENERVKIEQSKNSSELVIRKINKDDSGIYECIVKSNKASWTPSLYVRVKAPLGIKIRPKDVLLTTETGSFEWNCDNNEGSLQNAEYSWYRKLLPRGRWRRIENNNESYVWKIPQTLHTEAGSYDVYDLYCEITYRGTTVRGPLARVVITRADAVDTLGSCPEELSEGIRWDRTLLGMVDAQLCLEGDEDSGVAKRVCEAFPGRPPTWRIPNLQQCSSPEFNSLKEKFDALTEGFKVNLDIKKTLDELRSLTRPHQQPRPGTNHPARLFGKDLLSTVDILKTTRSLFKKEQGKKTLAMETLTSFTETASNLLDLENQDTWLEIEESNPETAADLVTSLDNFGFDLEEDFDGNDDIIENEVQKNLAFEMRRVNRGTRQGREDVIFRQNKSRIVLPRAIFTQESSEAVTVVSVIYDTLASILGDVNTTSNLSNHLALASNSSIISSTIKPLGAGKLKTPVRIVLENDGTSFDEHDQRRCVFWQPEITNSLWSDEGCRLVPENTTKFVTTCECDHFTLFAVMVESGKGGTDSEELAKLEMISTVGSAISLAAILLTMIIYIYYWKALWSTRFVNFINLCLAIALVDIFSVLRGPFKEDEGPCTAIGILLHFFVLALFMWMLCEGILLCLLLTDVFKKNYGRKWYLGVHLIGWGLPALIVVTSIGVRGASSYGLSGHCWLSRSHGFLWAAMGPMIVVLLASCSVYGIMLHSVITSQKVQQEDTLGKVKVTARASIIIMPVLGFTWTFAILDFFFDELAFKYLFAIFNSLQGLFIFLFHCLLNKQVQQAVFKKKRPEQRNILDRVKTQEFRMTGSHDSLESIR